MRQCSVECCSVRWCAALGGFDGRLRAVRTGVCVCAQRTREYAGRCLRMCGRVLCTACNLPFANAARGRWYGHEGHAYGVAVQHDLCVVHWCWAWGRAGGVCIACVHTTRVCARAVQGRQWLSAHVIGERQYGRGGLSYGATVCVALGVGAGRVEVESACAAVRSGAAWRHVALGVSACAPACCSGRVMP